MPAEKYKNTIDIFAINSSQAFSLVKKFVSSFLRTVSVPITRG
jgi:hypothetical protein